MAKAEAIKPILYVLGVPGQVHLARALKERFGRPVIGLTANARTDAGLTPETRACFSEILSLPDFYLKRRNKYTAMSRAALDDRQHALEEKFEIKNAVLDVHYDRALRWCGDYAKARHWHLATLEFIEKVLERHDPAFAIDGVAHILQISLRSALRKKNIPYLLTQNSRLNGHFNVLHENGHHVGFMETFTELEKGNSAIVKAQIVTEADEAFDRFMNRPRRPAYAEKNAVAGLRWDKLKDQLSNVRLRFNPSEEIAQVDRFLQYEADPVRSLLSGLRSQWRRMEIALTKVFDETPDLGIPYIYLPLHYAPEVSDMYFGAAYDHHAGFVTQFAKHIPSHMQVYVKEHTSMLGRRPAGFYRELNALYNVKMIAPGVNTFDLIRNAQAVATATGTAGWEAYLLGKPVIAMGDVFYNRLPGVYHARLDENFKPGLDKFLKDFTGPEQSRRNAFRAFYATSCPGTKGDIGPDITVEQAEGNAALFVEGLEKCIKEWGHTMEGAFPADMRDVPKSRKKRAVGA
ncbi:MAG: hypothetical protein K9G62_01890 [Alphaproteobacteria bacterium]|nr:hypothetical protein [Alphaproteobacteria bacterium]